MSFLIAIIELVSKAVILLNNNEKENEKFFNLKRTIDTTTSQVNQDTIQKYGSAAKEHIVAYSGMDNEHAGF